MEIGEIELTAGNGLDGRLSLLLSAGNEHTGDHPSVSGESGLVLAVAGQLPNLAENVVIQARSAEELRSSLSIDLPINKTTLQTTYLIIFIIIDHIEELVEERHLLTGDVHSLLLHGNINTSLVNVQLAEEI